MTIKDVAREAGVSVATISRVLNNSESVSEATREKVMDAIQKTGYQQNLLGRHLRCNKTNIILVMLTSIVNSYCAKLVHSIDDEARKHGYSIMICATDNDRDTEQRYINFLKNKFVDGIIIINTVMNEQEIAELSSSFPVVQCSEYTDSKNTPYVTINNKAAAYDAVNYLIQHGRKRIMHISVDNNCMSSKERLEGYKQALKDNGLEFDENLVLYGNYGYRNAHEITSAYFDKNGVNADGIFAISDKMAAGAVTSVIEKDKKVPDDVMVIGFDNTDITYIYNPTITTIAQPYREIGTAAVKMLLEIFDGKKCENLILKHELKFRETTNI